MSTHRECGGEGTLQRARAYRLLSHAYRRALVDCLDRRDAGIAMADAASEVASRNLEPALQETSHEEVVDVYAALHHWHVPKLVDEGIVDHDRDRNVVSLTERGRELAGVTDDVAAVADDGPADSAW